MLKTLRRSAEIRHIAHEICVDLLSQARAPRFFTGLKVPDTMDGRFDLAALHAWLVLERLVSDQRLSQAVVNEIFASFEDALRHLGTADVGVSRRLKTLASAFYGRLSAYRTAAKPADLAEAVWRNVYRGSEYRRMHADLLAGYATASRAELASAEISRGRLNFAHVPTI